MVETFTSDFVSVEDGDVTPYTPQQLVQQNALIEIVDAEAQWRGVSETEFNTETGSDTSSDSESAFIDIDRANNSSSDSGQTTGTVTTDSTTKTDSNFGSTQEGGRRSLSVSAPPDPRSQYPNAKVEPVRIEADYYVDESSGGDDDGVRVTWDDDPFDAGNYDSVTRLNINGDTKERVGGYSRSVPSWSYYNNLDGAQIKYLDKGSPYGTNSLEAEVTLVYEVTTREQEVNRENVSVVYPSTPSGKTFNFHRIVTFVNGEYQSSEREFTNKSGEVYSELTPQDTGDTKKIEIITRGTSRSTVSQTASVSYPDVPNTFSFDRHEVKVVDDGRTITDETVYENRVGQTVSRTSNKPTETVSVEITTFYSKTVKNIIRTTNPSLQEECTSDTLNTGAVSLLFDTSGSANQQEQKDIGRRIVRQLGDSAQVSVIDFDYNAVELVGLDTLESNKDDVIDAINGLGDSGGTDISVGLNEAADSLDGNDGTIVLITDGESGDDPISTAEAIGNTGIQIVTVQVGNGNTSVLQEIATVSGGEFFNQTINPELFGTVLDNNELSEWKEISCLTRKEQDFIHSIGGSGVAEFRFRFDWEYLTAEPTFGTTGFYDESAGIWREVAVADEEDSALQYTHVQVYNDEEDEWGVLDVVDLSNENTIEAFQFYDEDEGWLAPRQFNTV